MAKGKAVQPKAVKNRNVSKRPYDFHARRQRMAKWRTWAFVIWVIGIMLILAKWGRFGWTN